jgi:hypothetical protein
LWMILKNVDALPPAACGAPVPRGTKRVLYA